MALKLYNTLSLKKEEFKPLKNKKVGLYTCGPTVYNFVHIGNLRTFIFEDILRRILEHNNYQVKHVMNITDVGHLVSDENEGEDKMEKSAREQKKTAWDIAKFYTQEFKKDIADLNIEPAQIMPKATDHIKEQMALIKILEKKGFTYKTSDGIYFDTSKFKKYGKLGKVNIKGLKAGARIKKGDKKHHTDFALWKFSPQLGSRQAHRQMEWSSPWGVGFPGWHIECSAMAVKYLGQPFDIHTGGIDHIPIHHQNEIAQSEGAYNKPLANYWMHGEFLVIDKKKMAKSEGNFITLKILKEQGYHPLAYRFFVLNAHYRTQLNFSWEAMESAQAGLEHLYNQVKNLTPTANAGPSEVFKQKFFNAINDDLNTPKALAVMQELLKSNIKNENKLATILDFDKILGLKIKESLVLIKIPEKIKKIAEERLEARQSKDWNKSDNLRKKINQLGFEIKDTKDGYTLKKS